MLCILAGLNAEAQEVIKRTTRKPRKARTQQPAKAKTETETFQSTNGKMKAHTLTEQEEIEMEQKEKINAPQVNHGVNENMPPLSPSNGNGNK